MTLQVSNLDDSDFGYYKCVAINSLGRAEIFIEVKGTFEEEYQATDYEKGQHNNPERVIDTIACATVCTNYLKCICVSYCVCAEKWTLL